jgi:FkbM family methyltransferase|tara:strand:+ start:21488 stop:22180 length:693 start_codon:yes stop_codon:yes gene_type:complete
MDLVFDIGFNLGDFTKEVYKKFPNCKVIGVDANPEFNNVQLEGDFVFINRLVSNKDDDFVPFYIDPTQSGVSTASEDFMSNSRFAKGSKNLSPGSVGWTKKLEIPSITLDKLTNTFGTPDFVKVDVEGYEYEVLSGLTKKVGTICFEWHEEMIEVLYKCMDHLETIGYTEAGIIGYFDNKEDLKNMTYNATGDPYLVEPEKYISFSELKEELEEVCNPDRRVNYGMIFVK